MYFCTNTTCISLQIQNVFLNKYTNTVDERPWVSHVPAGSGLATTPAGINNTAMHVQHYHHHYQHCMYNIIVNNVILINGVIIINLKSTTPAGINNTALYNIIIIIKYQQCHCIYQHRHHYHHGQYHNNNQS